MFDVDEDGALIYVPDNDAGDSAADADGTLFDGSPEPSEALEMDAFEDALDDEASDEELPASDEEPGLADEDIDSSLTGSGNSVTLPVSGLSISGEEMSITTSGDVYIYPELPDEEPLSEMRSAYSATVQGLPNTTSLAYLEDVAAGYPSWYKYMAFKTDANYSQSMALWIAPVAVKNPAQNRIDFSGGVDCIQVNYVRSGSTSTYYYQYSKTHYDSYQIPYDSDVFLYTDVVDGYAELDVMEPYSITGIALLAFAVVVAFKILRGGGKD